MSERVRRAAGVAAVLLCCVALVPADGKGDEKDDKGDGKGTGTLTGSGGTTSFTSGLDVGGEIPVDQVKPYCTPKLYGQRPLPDVMGIGVQTLHQLGVVVRPLDKPMILHKLRLQLLEGDKVVWQTNVTCGGCGDKAYEPVQEGKGIGYLFKLDAEALAAAQPLFAKAAGVGLAGVVHGGGRLRLTFVNLGKQ